jgi:acetyl-CoA C-acetyltransferase
MSNNAYIVSAVRTAGGKKNGSLSQWHPADLGAKVLDELVHQSGIDPALIDDVIFGCVDQVGAQSGNVARNAILASSLPESVLELQLIDNAARLNKLFILQFKL